MQGEYYHMEFVSLQQQPRLAFVSLEIHNVELLDNWKNKLLIPIYPCSTEGGESSGS